MRFGSICSGIEAASVAWGPLGWKAAWLSEIDPFACAVLAHHYPETPNLGDMNLVLQLLRAGLIEAPDVLCGGTPCQAFSVAGLRRSLDDARGNLSLTFCEIANAIDDRRRDPCIIFWENVPGVLSTKDNAFGCFLAGLAGEDDPLQPPGGKWANAGAVYGPRRAVAWRVLDAQYFGVAQRRRRVFVVASAREGFDPAAVLFEFDGVRRDTAPRRESGEEAAEGSGPSPEDRSGVRYAYYSHDCAHDRITDSCGVNPALTSEAHASGNLNILAFGGNNQSGPIDVATARNACSSSSSGRLDFESETFLVQPAVAFNWNAQAAQLPGEGRDTSINDGLTCSQQGAVATRMQVRRLTPTECERLQGFPDGYTKIPWKLGYWPADKHSPEIRAAIAEQCPDGPRYKALGNSWAVPVVRWIGARIQGALS